YIDKNQSNVELWLYSDEETTLTYTIAQIEAGEANSLFADVIGVSVTYQGTDPELNGNRIVAGDNLTMHLDMQLRATHRVSQNPIQGGPVGSAVRVSNDAFALGQDIVVDPTATPTDGDDAYVD